jgi:uncharacterized lipoprotein YehR (DUF1307 family)
MNKQILLFVIGIIFSITVYNCKVDGNDQQPEWQTEDVEYIFINDDQVKVVFNESTEAFTNPMKGFRPTWSFDYDDVNSSKNEFASVYKHYIGYSSLEKTASDTAKKIIDWSNKAWRNIEGKNIKVIPRVVLTFPTSNQAGASVGNYWPDDISQPSNVSRWTTEELKSRLVTFVMKLAEAWDNDPRVAAIELGLWGNWGEYHLYPDSYINIPSDFQEALGTAFSAYFKNKKIMIRYPDTFQNYQFGFYWDSFALPNDSYNGEGIIIRDNWKEQMITGEVAYDWGDLSLLGENPDATLKKDDATDYLINWIKRTHASSLGWISDYNKNDNSLSKNAKRVQKILGYRYFINSVIYNRQLNPGEEILLELQISNIGAAPFYYKWPFQLILMNLNRKIEWKETVDIDIRQWLPDETNTIVIKSILPASLKADNYVIAVSILDPSGNLPSLRFANENYYNGGITPLGIIGIGREPKYDSFKPFNSLNQDNSLKYSK